MLNYAGMIVVGEACPRALGCVVPLCMGNRVETPMRRPLIYAVPSVSLICKMEQVILTLPPWIAPGSDWVPQGTHWVMSGDICGCHN